MGEVRQDRAVVRIIVIAIGLLLATAVLVALVLRVERVLVWLLIAVFFATALHPAADWIQRRLPWCPRWLATLAVFLVVVLALGGLLAAFAVPLARQGTALAGPLPQLISEARAGRGPVGDLLQRTHALEYVQQNQESIRSFAAGLGEPALNVLRGVGTGIIATITVLVLAFLLVLEGPKIIDGTLGLFPPHRAQRIRRVGAECARTVTGYLTGNLIISVICGTLTFLVLKILGVPFAGLIALFVAIVDLIPLIGATLGAIVAGAAGFIHSVTAGIVVVVFFVLYQQLENHLLQPVVFSRTVKLDPLTVLVSILIAAELAGILGALLAIPIASIIRIILRDLWRNRATSDHHPPETPESTPPQRTDDGDRGADPGSAGTVVTAAHDR
ncbi:AI-2E family transporter [Actinophytocola sp.]|uniref:AI-2E family transporter n=1 Tax=Actinophytocola sp. TaxID=1872138 RepID=UPI002D7E9FD1|nr:AI-2E family transporter [Actinophytocola sp.]HET9143619.1 AI-2E family transporter [Actinophytocola sp.]